jgi:hypothetical protein
MMPNTPKGKVAKFWGLCAHIYNVYDLYNRLYWNDPRLVAICDSVAPLSFRLIHHILKEYILLQFAKITDPTKTGSFFNYTTNYIIDEIDWPNDVLKKLKEINADLMTFRKYIKDMRNQRIAHYDFDSEIERKVLGSFPKNEEIYFLRNLENFVNIAYGHFHNGDCVPIRHTTSPDIDNLLETLVKDRVFDLCAKFNETERFAALTAFESSQSAKAGPVTVAKSRTRRRDSLCGSLGIDG